VSSTAASSASRRCASFMLTCSSPAGRI